MPDREAEDWKWVDEKAGYRKPTIQSENLKGPNNKYIGEKTASVHSIKEKYNRSDDEDASQKKRDRRWDRAGTVGLWLAAIAGVWAIISSSNDADQQRGIMRAQIDVMSRQFEPRLSFDFKFDDDGSSEPNWRLTPRWRNVGGGEAVSFKGWDSWRYYTDKEPDVRDLIFAPADTVMNSINIGVQDIIDQHTVTVPRQVGINYINGVGNFLLWGYVEYKGPFPSDQIIKRHYCFKLAFEKGKNGVVMTLPSVYKSECNKTE